MGFITIVATGGGGGDDDDSPSPWITIDSPSTETVITYHKNIRLVGSAWISTPNASCSDGTGVTVHYENETTGDSGYAQQYWDCSLCPTLRPCPTNHTWSAEVAIEETTNRIKVMALSAGGSASDQITVIYSANLPPTTPTNLVANAISRFQIDLSWGASTDDYGLIGYKIYRDGVYLKSVTGTSASDTGLTPDTDYCYTVTAYDVETIESAPSNQECVTTLPDFPPTAPANLFANAVSFFQIDLSWDASTDDYGIAGYKIYRDGVYLKSVTGTSASATGLTPDTDYCYTVTAYDTVGNESAMSNQACATTPPDLTPPTIPTDLAVTIVSPDGLNLEWGASSDNINVIGYNIYRDGIYLKSVSLTSNSDTGLDKGTLYCYEVSAYDAAGNESATSNQVCAKTWEIVALGNITSDWASSIAIDSGDNVHIFYAENGLKHVYNSSGSWDTELISAGPASINSLALDSADNVHIIYYANNDLMYSSNATGTWVTQTADTQGDYGSSVSMALDSADRVHISYLGKTNYDLKYATNASGAWVTQTLDSQGYMVGSATSMALDSADNAHIAYAETIQYDDLRYATNASGAWVTQTLDSQGDVGSFTSIALDSADNVHIVYEETMPNDNLKYVTNASGLWVIETVDGKGYQHYYPSIIIDSNNNVHVIYKMFASDGSPWDNYDIKYATHESGIWNMYTIFKTRHHYERVKAFPVSIVMDSLNNMHISYSIMDSGDAWRLRYATNR
ncbi:MAG: hypothetical protein ACYTBV_14090 [Planctomycetota bacterium]